MQNGTINIDFKRLVEVAHAARRSRWLVDVKVGPANNSIAVVVDESDGAWCEHCEGRGEILVDEYEEECFDCKGYGYAELSEHMLDFNKGFNLALRRNDVAAVRALVSFDVDDCERLVQYAAFGEQKYA